MVMSCVTASPCGWKMQLLEAKSDFSELLSLGIKSLKTQSRFSEVMGVEPYPYRTAIC